MDNIVAKTHFKNTLVYIEPEDKGGKPFAALPKIPFYSYKGGKVCVSSDDVKFEEFISRVAGSYRNGMLVVDEAGLYKNRMFEKNGDPIEPLMKLMKQRRKYNVECYFLYHSVSEIPVHLFYWCNALILFHQTGEFKHKAGVVPRVSEMVAMQKRIAQKYFSGNLYYSETLKLS
jgi:hypothetical protein